jgi:hypothetical protein
MVGCTHPVKKAITLEHHRGELPQFEPTQFLNGLASRSFTDGRIQTRFGASDMAVASQRASGSRSADLQLFQLSIQRREP